MVGTYTYITITVSELDFVFLDFIYLLIVTYLIDNVHVTKINFVAEKTYT